ncbi:MAG TPA: hypothetical protein VET26_12375 [Candidatus Sulfotelmatobacter sp.]|nr:hypothetical protein [Candidatus Sulfotelmatobacter sp.]
MSAKPWPRRPIADRVFVDALREYLGLSPLYTNDKLRLVPDVERFDREPYCERPAMARKAAT